MGSRYMAARETLSEKDFISSRCYTLLSYLAVTGWNRATANQLALILWPDESCEYPDEIRAEHCLQA